MLVVVSAAMVVVAAVLLVAHFVVDGSGLVLVYSAMALAVGSMVVLQVAKWRSSPGAHLARSEPIPRPGRVAEPGPSPVAPPSPAEAAVEPPPPGEEGFPITDYDSLAASQVLPMLASLDDRQLDQVAARERAGKARAAILEAIAEIRPAQRRSMTTETAAPSTTSR